MQKFVRIAAGFAAAALLLTALPGAALAHDAAVVDDYTDGLISSDGQLHTQSTSGRPELAAMLNAGTVYSVQLNQARANGIEVAGVNTSADGSPLMGTISTMGDPTHAALLNAGTAYNVLTGSGQ